MPVINNTPTKTLSACDAAQGALFTTAILGCSLRIGNASPLVGITNIEYEIKLGATIVDTINTTATFYDWAPASLYYGDTLRIKQTITSSLGTYEYTADVGIPSSLESCTLTFDQNNGASDTFDPTVTVGGGVTVYWRLPDNIVRTGATLSVAGSLANMDGTTKEVRVTTTNNGAAGLLTYNSSDDKIVGFVDYTNASNLTSIVWNNNANLTGVSTIGMTALQTLQLHVSGLTGAFSTSGLTALRTLYLYQNAALTNLTLEKTAPYIDIRVQGTGLSGALDLSNIAFGTNSYVQGNSLSITSVNTSGCSGSISNWYFYSCASLAGVQDLSMFTFGLNPKIWFDNSPITGITFSGSPGNLNWFLCGGTNLSGTVDLTNFTLVSTCNLKINQTTVSSLLLPASGRPFAQLWIYSSNMGVLNLNTNTITASASVRYEACSMTTAEVNENLVNLDNAAVTSGASGSIDISGSNAAPDGSTGGFDGTTAVANLISYGYTVTTT